MVVHQTHGVGTPAIMVVVSADSSGQHPVVQHPPKAWTVFSYLCPSGSAARHLPGAGLALVTGKGDSTGGKTFPLLVFSFVQLPLPVTSVRPASIDLQNQRAYATTSQIQITH